MCGEKLETEIEKDLKSLNEKIASIEFDEVSAGTLGKHIAALEEILGNEESRNQRVESKATTILSAAGLIATFVFGIVGLYVKISSDFNRAVLTTIGLLVFLSIISLGASIYYSLAVLKVKNYAYPGSIPSILREVLASVKEIRIERFRDLLKSITQNERVINQKVDHFKKAQKYFSTAAFLLLVDTAVIITYALVRLLKC